MTDPENLQQLRADKWLWAARFFKTRSLAKAAIEGGKVQMNGQRIKVSTELTAGDILTVRQGWDKKEIVVKAISAQRKSAPITKNLYEETADSTVRRQREASIRRAAGPMAKPDHRPDKQQRRQMTRFYRQIQQHESLDD